MLTYNWSLKKEKEKKGIEFVLTIATNKTYLIDESPIRIIRPPPLPIRRSDYTQLLTIEIFIFITLLIKELASSAMRCFALK